MDFERKLQPTSASSHADHRPLSAPSKPRSETESGTPHSVRRGNDDALLVLDRKHTAGLTFSRFVKARVDLSFPGFSFPEEEQLSSSPSSKAIQLVLSENGESSSGACDAQHSMANYGDNMASSKMFAVHRGLNVRDACSSQLPSYCLAPATFSMLI